MFVLLHSFKRFASYVRHIPARRVDTCIKQDIDAGAIARSGMLDSVT